MFTYLIIFCASLFLIVGMLTARILYKKLHDEHVFHKIVTFRARKVDLHIKERLKKFKRFLRYFNKKTFTLFIHLLIEETEYYFHKLTDFIKSKFPHK